jgi:hypothetical protein
MPALYRKAFIDLAPPLSLYGKPTSFLMIKSFLIVMNIMHELMNRKDNMGLFFRNNEKIDPVSGMKKKKGQWNLETRQQFLN